MKPKHKTILLIDDESTVHSLIKTYLEKAGYQLLSAYTGQQGLDLIVKHHPTLILLDYFLPDKNGDQVYAEFMTDRRYAKFCQIPVIVLTAKASDSRLRTKFLQSGVSAYLQKPFGLKELLNVIENVFISAEIRLQNQRLQNDLQKTHDYLESLIQISDFMLATVDLDELLHLILTAITAGCAMGFSRAMILLKNQEKETLEGRMGVGPSSKQEAHRIWTALGKESISLPNFLEKYGRKTFSQDEGDYFNVLVKKIVIPLSWKDSIFVQALDQNKVFKLHRDHVAMGISSELLEQLQLDEFVIVPLFAKDRVIGVVVADNQFSQYKLDQDRIHLLTLFANQAGLAIEKVETYSRLEQEKNKLLNAYEELQKAQERLIQAERLATIGKVAAEVAHEIRNPLVTIGGFARLIPQKAGKGSDHELKNIANIIVEEVSRLEHILNNILDFSRLSKPSLISESINKIIDESCLYLAVEQEMSKKGVRLYKQLDPLIPNTLMDPQQIKQVLLNLIQNALQSMLNGGSLYIVTTIENDNLIRISIKDTGVGMPAEILDQLFNPFFTTKKNGIGLGLLISRQIIHSHGGEIYVKSEVGKGTTFSFTLKIIDDINTFQELMNV